MRKHQSTDKTHFDLQFNVAQLLKDGVGSFRHYDLTVESIGTLDAESDMISPMSGPVKLICTGRTIFVTGKLKATVEKSCGRCLAPFNAEVVIELEEEFFPSIDIHSGHHLPNEADVDEINLIDEQHILNLHEVVRQEFVLSGEIFRYCKADCLGLCPVCGRDRNTDPCDCQKQNIDSRWTNLLTLSNN